MPNHLETTRVYFENLAYYLADKVKYCCVCVAVANVCKNYLKSLGRKSKTDKIDVQGIAQMGIERQLNTWKKPDDTLLELRKLSRERDALRLVTINR